MLNKTIITPYQPAHEIVITSGAMPLSADLAKHMIDADLDRNHMIPRGRTGSYIFPADLQMDMLLASYDLLVDPKLFKSDNNLAVKQTQWITHCDLDQQIEFRYTITRYEPVLGCVNVWWLGEMVDFESKNVLCSYQRCQRWYIQ